MKKDRSLDANFYVNVIMGTHPISGRFSDLEKEQRAQVLAEALDLARKFHRRTCVKQPCKCRIYLVPSIPKVAG